MVHHLRLHLAALLLASASPLQAPAQVTAQDSGGIRIVTNTGPVWTTGRAWTLSARPIFEVGSGDDTLYQFATVMGAARLSDGSVAVANMGSNSIRIYDARGRHVRTVGRQGQGPGEFRQVMGLVRLPADTIAVMDSRNEVEFFSSDGKWVRNTSTPAVQGGLVLGGLALFDDGTYARSSWPQGHDHPAGRWVDSLVVVGFSPSTPTGRTMSRHPAVEFTKTAAYPITQAVTFGPRGGIVSSGVGYYVSWGERYEIRHHRRDGSLEAIIRAPWTPTPVRSADTERYKESIINLGAEGGGQVDPRLLAQRRRMMEEVSFARQLPAYSLLRVDADRNIWVRDSYAESEIGQGFSRVLSTPTTWRVFDRTGRWLGTVTMPARFNAMDIGTDYVLGLWRDDDDVEHVRMYRLVKPE